MLSFLRGDLPENNVNSGHFIWMKADGHTLLQSPLVPKIRFVAYKHDDNIATPLCTYIIYPLRRLVEWVCIWNEMEDGVEIPSSN